MHFVAFLSTYDVGFVRLRVYIGCPNATPVSSLPQNGSAAKAKTAILRAQESVSARSLSEIKANRAGLAVSVEPEDCNRKTGATTAAQQVIVIDSVVQEKLRAHTEKLAAAARARAAIAAAKLAAYRPRAMHSPTSTLVHLHEHHNAGENERPDIGTDAAAVTEGNLQYTIRLCGWDMSFVARDARYWATTLSFLALSLIIALSVRSLGTVLAFVGATGSTMVSFILPGFCYYWIFDERSGAPKWKRYVYVCASVFFIDSYI